MTRPSPGTLFAEVATLAERYHWSLDSLLDLEHADRRRFVDAGRHGQADHG